jgi:phenylpropionate dioxygenase-like ring-hydroxylating dioxygenase large terminal subunit
MGTTAWYRRRDDIREGDALMSRLADDAAVVQRIFDHIDRHTTDRGETTWREPVANYRNPERLQREVEQVLRRLPVPFCPSVALANTGDYVARTAAGVPLVAVRGADGRVRAFRNACRHRGMQVAEGSGCKRAFICPYHAWTYDLEGRLRGVPHEDGFPGLDRDSRGLVPVAAAEVHGLVFITQDGPAVSAADYGELEGVVRPTQRLASANEREVAANWKVLAEGFLEGYHLRSLHPDTFYPIQFDNLNIIGRFGRNSRVTFPYRRIEKQRELPAAQRSTDGVLTHVYHLFPNAMVITFSTNTTLAVIEPLGVDRTRLLTWVLDGRHATRADDAVALDRDLQFIEAGSVQDREAAEAIQRGLASGANDFFEFGHFESALVHLHRNLHGLVGD